MTVSLAGPLSDLHEDDKTVSTRQPNRRSLRAEIKLSRPFPELTDPNRKLQPEQLPLCCLRRGRSRCSYLLAGLQ